MVRSGGETAFFSSCTSVRVRLASVGLSRLKGRGLRRARARLLKAITDPRSLPTATLAG